MLLFFLQLFLDFFYIYFFSELVVDGTSKGKFVVLFTALLDFFILTSFFFRTS